MESFELQSQGFSLSGMGLPEIVMVLLALLLAYLAIVKI